MGTLTALQVKNAKAGRHSDGKGLHLLVSPTGAKSWVLRVQKDGRRRDFGLGPIDLVSLQEAREKAIEGRKMVRLGFDPSLEWKRVQNVIPTFEVAARKYHENIKAGWKNGKHGAQWLSTLETHAFPIIGNKRVDLIDTPAIQSVLLPIWLTIPETARRVRQRVGAVLDFAHGQGWRPTEAPMRAISKRMPKQPRNGGHFAAMPYADRPDFMEKLRAADASVGRLALQFAILTAARSGEVRGATWGEVDMNKATWTIPAERMKAAEGHVVPLSDAALDVLREVQGFITGRPGEPIFPGLKGKPGDDGGCSPIHGPAGCVHLLGRKPGACARLVRKRWPNLDLVVCADDDAHLLDHPTIQKNLGLEYAKAAAAAVGGRLAVPPNGGA